MLKRVIKKRSGAGRMRREQFVAMFHAPSRMIRRMTASYCAWSGRGGSGLPSTGECIARSSVAAQKPANRPFI